MQDGWEDFSTQSVASQAGCVPLRETITVWQGIAPARQQTDAGIAGRQLSDAEDSSHPMAATGGGTWKVSDTL